MSEDARFEDVGCESCSVYPATSATQGPEKVCFALCHSVVFSTTQYYTVLLSTTQYYFVLHSTTLYYTVIHINTHN